MSERINYFNFHNKNVIYMFHTTIKSNRGVPVLKIGFTNNLFERIKSLEKHYDAKFKLIGVKECDRLSDEKLFHKMILLKYGDEFTYTGIFKKTRSTELYYYDERLLNEFEDFDPGNSRNFYINININNEMKVDDHVDMDCSDHSSDSDYEPTDMDESGDSDSEMDTSDSEQDCGDEEVLGDTDSETEEDEEVSADEGPSESDSDDCDEPPSKKHCSITDRWRMDSS
jgi:hypothetical protein